MKLKGTKTHQNLKDAFAGESQALLGRQLMDRRGDPADRRRLAAIALARIARLTDRARCIRGPVHRQRHGGDVVVLAWLGHARSPDPTQ